MLQLIQEWGSRYWDSQSCCWSTAAAAMQISARHLLCTKTVASNLILKKSPCCPGLHHSVRHGYVSMLHACAAQAAADPRKATYCHGTCSRLSHQGLQTLWQLLQPLGSLRRVQPPCGKLQMKAGGRSMLDITNSCQALARTLLKAEMHL